MQLHALQFSGCTSVPSMQRPHPRATAFWPVQIWKGRDEFEFLLHNKWAGNKLSEVVSITGMLFDSDMSELILEDKLEHNAETGAYCHEK